MKMLDEGTALKVAEHIKAKKEEEDKEAEQEADQARSVVTKLQSEGIEHEVIRQTLQTMGYGWRVIEKLNLADNVGHAVVGY